MVKKEKQSVDVTNVRNKNGRRKHFIDPDVIIIGSSSDEAEPDSSDMSDSDPVTAVPTDVVATQTVSSDTQEQQVSMQSGYPPVIQVHHILHYAQGNYPLPSQSIMTSVPSAISPYLFSMPFHHAPMQYPPHAPVHPPPHAPVHGLVHPPYVPHHAPVHPLHAPVHVPGHAPVPPLHAPVHVPGHAPVPLPHAPVHVPGHAPVPPPHAPVHLPGHDPVHPPHALVHPLPNAPVHGLVHPPYVPHHAPVHPPPHAPVHVPGHAPVHPLHAPVHVPGHDPVHPSPHAPHHAPVHPPHAPVHVPGHDPVHPPPHAPVHVPGHAPVHPPVHAPVHVPGHAPVHPSPHAPPHAPVHPPPHAPPHAPVHPPPHAPHHAPVHPPPHAPHHVPGHAPVHPSPRAPHQAPVHPPPHAPHHAPVHPSLHAPHHAPVHPSLHAPHHAPVHPSPHAPHHAPVHPPPHAPVHVPGHAPVHPSPRAPVHPPPHAPVHGPVHPPYGPHHALVHPPYGPHHAPVHPPHAPGHDPMPDTHHKAPNALTPPTTAVEAKANAPAPPTTTVKAKSNAPAPPTTTVKAKSNAPAPPTSALKAKLNALACVTTSIHRRQTTPSGPICIPAQPLHNKRKIKSHADDDVPHDEPPPTKRKTKKEEVLLQTASKEDALEMAQEKNVYKPSINAVKYKSDVMNVIKKLRTQRNVTAAKGGKGVGVQNSRGRIPLKTKMLQGNAMLYDGLKEYLLTEQTRIEQGYPFRNTRKRYAAVLLGGDKRVTTDSSEKICSRCGATYSVGQTGRHTRMKECNYHYGKGVEQRVPGGVETRYSCCEAVMGSPGCQVFKLHVHDGVSLDGFVFTQPRPTIDTSCPGVYSLNCEKCYTTRGVELSRVTLVNSSMQILYDTFVRPANDVIDYNTRFSGISEKNVKEVNVSIKEVQKTLLNLIRADTILIGHSLDMDLCLLKLTHEVVVDTSVVFPHSLGPPHKLALNTLVADHLRKIVQDRASGHDTAEDALACMELMLWMIKEGGRVRRV